MELTGSRDITVAGKVGWIKLIQRLVRFMHRRQHGLVSITGRQMGVEMTPQAAWNE